MAKRTHQKESHNIQDLLLSNSCEDNSNIYTVFSTLGFYILSNDEHRAAIIKHRTLYIKILNCLNSTRSLQTVIVLNFISAMLYINVDEGPTRKKALYIYAQNMIRVSGCLSAMCDLFMSSMMHQDIWRALCRSLAAACRGSTPSQNGCSHLVPLCIQRCKVGNLDAVIVLQALLENHKNNNKIFHINSGLSIFSRNLLHDTACLQLLNTVIENFPIESARDNLLLANKILTELHKLSISVECSPEIVQWKSIIFYSYRKVLGRAVINEDVKIHNIESFEVDNTKDCNDTEVLFQNVFREVRNLYCNRNNTLVRKKENDALSKDVIHRPLRRKCINKNTNFKKRFPESSFTSTYKNITRKNKDDFSFSFLLDMNSATLESNIEKLVKNIERNSNETNLYDTNKIIQRNQTIRTDFMGQHPSSNDCDINFKPSFASTPKKPYSIRNDITNTSCRTRYNMRKNSIPKSRVGTQQINSSVVGNRSLSSKFLEAVNQSCTTIVKSFKRVFHKKSPNQSKDNRLNQTNTSAADCNFSFTNYVRNRDGIFSGEFTNSTISQAKDTYYNISCSTCNNTLDLKHKMAGDQRLRQTIRKLKLGINLFGCDFKKISNTFWPNEKFITPNLLYNLYRKLIVK